MSAQDACAAPGSSPAGLTIGEAGARLKRHGANLVTREQRLSIGRKLWNRTSNPLNALLVILAIASYLIYPIYASWGPILSAVLDRV